MDQDIYCKRIAEISFPLGDGVFPHGLLDSLRKQRVVVIGESSHGSHEFYEWRNLITRELLEHHGFRFVAVEADWAPCQKLDRALRASIPGEIRRGLEGLDRWPTWMWGNVETEAFLNRLRCFNQDLPPSEQRGFHGIDLYSLFESVDGVTTELATIDEAACKKALKAYSCFGPYHRDELSYVRSLAHATEAGCRPELLDIKNYLKDILYPNEDQRLNVLMNAGVVVNAERYYSAMVNSDDQSWDLRETHLLEAFSNLLDYYGDDSKAVVWLHNSHACGHRELKRREPRRLRFGGLVRERFGAEQVSLIGLSTYKGMVLASNAWEGQTMELPIPLGQRGSLEEEMHEAGKLLKSDAFYINLREEPIASPLREERGHRLIGAVYHPGLESKRSYPPVSLTQQFDAFLFVDETTPVSPLEIHCDRSKIPETYPFNDRI